MRRTRTRLAALTAAALIVSGVAVSRMATAEAAAGCRVTYTVTNQWQGGFGASVDITNLGDPITSWALTYAFPSGQTVTQLWNGTYTQSGSQVSVRNVSYNGTIATNATASFGFNGAFTATNAAPTAFTLNGTACTGGVTNPPTTNPPTTTPPTSTPPTTTPPTTAPPSTCSVTAADPNATAAARRLLCYLYSVYGNHILSGQQESTWVDGPEFEMNYIHNATGRYPAIRGLDMGDSPDFGARAMAWWNAGGIPMVGYHMGAPNQSVDGYNGSLMTANINAALTEGSSDNATFKRRMDGAAAQLAQVQAGGGAVLWRPFHEAGGTWFWWSKEGGGQYVRLWRYMFDYFTKTKGLHNLVWLHPFDGEPDASFYPGKAFVDIGGADTYAGDHGPLTSLFNRTKAVVGSTVPIALHENGRIPDPAQLQSTATRWVLFNTWHSTFVSDTSINPVSTFQAVYSSAYVITRDEVPNLH